MKYHILVKFLAIVLCALSLLAVIVSGIGVNQLIDIGLYEDTVDALQNEHLHTMLNDLAKNIAGRHAAANLSNCPEEFIEQYFGTPQESQLEPDLWFYTLEDAQGKVLGSNYAYQDTTHTQHHEFVVAPEYPVILDYRAPGSFTEDTTQPTGETLPEDELPQNDDFRYSVGYGWRDEEGLHYYTLGIYRGPAYLVTIHLLPGAYTQESSQEWELLRSAYEYRYILFIPLVAGMTVFSLLLVYLCGAAGRSKRRREVRPGGLNMLPIDLYTAMLLCCAVVLTSAMGTMAGKCFTPMPNWGAVGMLLLMGFGMCLLAVAFLFAMAAQMKTKNAYLLRHSLVGTLAVLCWRILCWLWKLLSAGVRWLWQCVLNLFAMMPMVWQWILTGGIMMILLLAAVLIRNVWLVAAVMLLDVCIVLYGAYAFGTLMKSAREMSHGDLSAQVDDRVMAGSFRDFAGHLNALAGVAVVAGQNQAKSERTKAELITNVSHDIKTPLTSIINYVDLLKRARSPQEAESHLEVLDRQSQRLKKLIDDLMDMSKASTGNMPVDITVANAVETVMQALGEFSDKLEAAGLMAVFNPPEETMNILADGRLTWRVLSNLFSNAVKYALPGTRVYVEMSRENGYVVIRVKNVSRDELSINSDGLLERFVRGDTSRNTEGSGLGLNIAHSLMELQKGKLQLQVDGDLFNAILMFPEA